MAARAAIWTVMLTYPCPASPTTLLCRSTPRSSTSCPSRQTRSVRFLTIASVPFSIKLRLQIYAQVKYFLPDPVANDVKYQASAQVNLWVSA